MPRVIGCIWRGRNQTETCPRGPEVRTLGEVSPIQPIQASLSVPVYPAGGLGHPSPSLLPLQSSPLVSSQPRLCLLCLEAKHSRTLGSLSSGDRSWAPAWPLEGCSGDISAFLAPRFGEPAPLCHLASSPPGVGMGGCAICHAWLEPQLCHGAVAS